MKAWTLLACVFLLVAAQLANTDEKPEPQAEPTVEPQPAPQADPRIAAVLKSLGYQFEMTRDQDYRVVFEVDDAKRTQLVVVNSNTETYDKTEFREVWSPALVVDDPLDPALAVRLLKANDRVKLGAWRVWPADRKGDRDQLYVVFAAQIDANAPADVLAAACDMVTYTADALEKEITGADER